jgi:4-hydroxythreonine-4-phosphate dehydrogenase
MSEQKPLIAVTLGDPAGVGPEVVAKALADDRAAALCRIVVVGDAAVLDRAFALVGSPLRAAVVVSPGQAVAPGAVGVLQEAGDGLAELPYGRVSATAGEAAVRWATAAAKLAMNGSVAAVATAPISKEAANLAGYSEIGHQELYQELTGVDQIATMLVTTGLRVVHLTTHHSLRVACAHVTRQNVLAKLKLTHDFFAAHGYAKPRIAAAALNPHGGEAGIIGSEEIEEIAPAVEDARALGIDVTGPIPADSVFGQAVDGRYDVVLAMYHDQGHIAIKVHDWAASTTTNLGLPFTRTSVDHGTAFDIAGQGIADPTGMIHAIRLAANLAADGTISSA